MLSLRALGVEFCSSSYLSFRWHIPSITQFSFLSAATSSWMAWRLLYISTFHPVNGMERNMMEGNEGSAKKRHRVSLCVVIWLNSLERVSTMKMRLFFSFWKKRVYTQSKSGIYIYLVPINYTANANFVTSNFVIIFVCVYIIWFELHNFGG